MLRGAAGRLRSRRLSKSGSRLPMNPPSLWGITSDEKLVGAGFTRSALMLQGLRLERMPVLRSCGASARQAWKASRPVRFRG
jgi:hypothetical protein